MIQKKLNDEQRNQMKDLENQISQLQKKSKEIFQIKGQIVASVERKFFINAEIDLICSTLDTRKSKVIISTSDAKCLGSEAYEKGQPITSLHMNTTLVCQPGRYYVRCIVFNSNGESNEIVSKSVTTSVSSLTFDYEGRKAPKISLPKGQYKLEVWGAKWGDSTGNGQSGSNDRGNSTVKGGLGGYSRGILSLNKQETVYAFVAYYKIQFFLDVFF